MSGVRPRVVVGLLGPLVVTTPSGTTPVRGRQQGTVLAMLASALGRVIPTDAFVEHAWAGRPPPTAGAALRVHVASVRRLIGAAGDGLRHQGSGYALDPALVTTDAAHFEAVAAEATAGAPTAGRTRAAALEEALALWRGTAFSGFEDVEPLGAHGRRLEEARLAMEEDWLNARLTLRDHEAVCQDAVRLVEEAPLRKRRTAQLVWALCRWGRQAEALAAAGRLRGWLAD